MKKKVTPILAYLLVALLALTGCAPSTPSGGDGSSEAQTFKISFIPQSMSNPFFVTMEEGVKQAIEDYKAKGINIELSTQAPQEETDAEAQLQFVENAITSGADAILLLAISPTGLIPGVLKANEAGVKVVNIDCGLDMEALKEQGGEIVTYIGSDNVEGGRMAGQAMVEYFKDTAGEVEVGIIEGLPGHINAEARKKGFNEGVANSNIKVVSSQTANWDMNQGYQVMQNMISANPKIQAIFACNDQMGLGAIAAIKDAGMAGKIQVFSFDCTVDGLQAVKDGTMYGTVAQYAVDMGYRGVEIAIESLTDPNAKFDEKIFTKVEFISKDNVNDAP